MKNLSKLLVIIFSLVLFNAHGQDYILKVNAGIEKVYCDSITIKNDTIEYLSIGNNVADSVSVVDMYAIHFYDNQPDELLLLSFNIDTITSTIDSISNANIYYKDDNRLLHSIKKKDVFGILFRSDINKSKIESFFDKYVQLQKINYDNSPKLIKKDGGEVRILSLNTLVNDTLEIHLKSKQNTINTYASAISLDSYINKEPVDRVQKTKYKNYIYAVQDTIEEVIIDQFIDDKIVFSIFGENGIIPKTQNKKSLAGIFFYDYSEDKIDTIPEVVIVPPVKEKKPDKVKDKFEPQQSKFIFDVGLGVGYMLNLERSFDLPSENESHFEKIRLGVSFSASVKMHVTKRFGVGLKYNQFNTSNEDQDVISEKIRIMFAGGTLFGNIPVLEDRGLFSVDLSLGLLAKNEKFTIDNDPYYLKGNTIGVYVTTGLDYFVTDNISLGFSLGLLGGSLEKNDIRSDYDILLDKSSSLSRFDGMVTFKYYL